MQTQKRVKVTHTGQASPPSTYPQQQLYNRASVSSSPPPAPMIAPPYSSPQKTLIMKTFTPREKQLAKRRLSIFVGFAIIGFIIGFIFGIELGLLEGLGIALLGAYWGGGFVLLLILAFYLINLALFFKIAIIKVIVAVVAAVSFFITPFILLHAIYILRDGKLPFLFRHIAQLTHLIYKWIQTMRSNP